MELQSRCLNLGCGTDIRTGWINVDRVALPGVDRVVDLSNFPWPLADQAFEFVLAKDVLEHCQNQVLVLEEIWRILQPGGTLRVQVPHFTSRGAHLDPTHLHSYSVETFDYFVVGHQRAYYTSTPYSGIDERRITFDTCGKLSWNKVLERFVNASRTAQRAYESTPLRIFPAMNVEVILRK